MKKIYAVGHRTVEPALNETWTENVYNPEDLVNEIKTTFKLMESTYVETKRNENNMTQNIQGFI